MTGKKMASFFFPSVIQMQFQSVHSKNIAQSVEMSNTESHHWPLQSSLLEHRNVTRSVFCVGKCLLHSSGGSQNALGNVWEVPDIFPFPPNRTSENFTKYPPGRMLGAFSDEHSREFLKWLL
ncbi:hypothetical protein CDAR_378271 [Caerostris darwini]|uniref:Uncharacterized protein n=1 Tax=Caerostris darwini TaxID=1538125 RepID=A0AAV4T7G6_9ARAC|nr:hypothetical protein CDAR_378271 [Caerostris darwini]